MSLFHHVYSPQHPPRYLAQTGCLYALGSSCWRCRSHPSQWERCNISITGMAHLKLSSFLFKFSRLPPHAATHGTPNLKRTVQLQADLLKLWYLSYIINLWTIVITPMQVCTFLFSNTVSNKRKVEYIVSCDFYFWSWVCCQEYTFKPIVPESYWRYFLATYLHLRED